MVINGASIIPDSKEENDLEVFLKQRAPWAPFKLIYPLLLLLSTLYSCMIRLRNFFYDVSLFKSHQVPVRVVCIGNITAGGAGKTPLTLLVAKETHKRGRCPGVLARGYKGKVMNGEILNDEGLMLKQALPELILEQNPDRVTGAYKAINRGADFLIMDDGFQHRRLKRHMDILVIDATQPFGFDRVLPAGLLREPLSGIRRAHCVILTRCDQVSSKEIEKIKTRVRRYLPSAPIYQTIHAPDLLRSPDGSIEEPLNTLQKKKGFLFCAIANPQAFERTASSLGIKIVGQKTYPDHHWYDQSDVEAVLEQAKAVDAQVILTTAKDGVKLQDLKNIDGFRVIEIGLEFMENIEPFWNLIFSE